VSFTKNFAPNQNLMTLTEGDTSVSMALLTLQSGRVTAERTATARVVNPNNLLRTAEDAMNAVFSSSVTYEGVLPDTDLEYTVDASSVKEYIVVNQPQTSYAYHFALTLMGLTARMEEDGSVGLYTAEGEKKYTIPAPYMFDAAGSFSEAVAYTLLGEGGKFFLTVTADTAWLNDPARTWPVKIDPTVIASTGEPHDTYIDSSTVATKDQNYGDATKLLVGNNQIAYIKTSSFSIPSGTTLDWAYLSVFYYFPADITSGSITVNSHRIEMPWAEAGLTWNIANEYTNQGLFDIKTDSQIFAYSNSATQSAPVQANFDITGTVLGWLNGESNLGIAIKKSGGVCSYIYLHGYSANTTNYRPRISYQYSTPDFLYFNYCDSTFTSAQQSKINAAIQGVNYAFTTQFRISFASSGSAESNSDFADACSSTGLCAHHTYDDNSVRWDHYHKNTNYITEVLLTEINAETQRGIYWSDHNCVNGVPEFCWHDNKADNACSPRNSFAMVVEENPVIVVMDLPTLPTDSTYTSARLYEACMGFMLIHETAHTFGMSEPYKKQGDTEHQEEGSCFMSKLTSGEDAYATFYYAVLEGRYNGFCENCADELASKLP